MRARHIADATLQQAVGRLRRRYGGPCLIYDLDRIGAAARALAAIGERTGVEFIGAAKALPLDGLIEAADDAFGGFDVSNGGEMARLASWRQRTGKEGLFRYLAMTGPALQTGMQEPSPLSARLTVNIESAAQLPSFERLAGWGVEAELGLRIGQPLYRSSGAASMTRFGFTGTDTEQLAALVGHPGFAGFHCHVDGDQAIPDAHLAALDHLVKLGRDLGVRPAVYNLGGGLRTQSLEEIARLCSAARGLAPAGSRIVFEPGAWLAAQGGYALCRVIEMRHRPDLGSTMVTLDLAADAHCRWSSLRLAGWWGSVPKTRRLLFFGPTAYEGDYLGAFEIAGGERSGDAGEAEPGFALFSGVTGYSATFNVDFNGIARAKVLSIGRVDGV